MVLLHLGPGYLNGGANTHNAKKAFTPLINVIGEHAMYHRGLDAPLSSDIESTVKPNHRWVGVAESAEDAAQRASEAFTASMVPPGGPVALLLPADTAWNECPVSNLKAAVKPAPSREPVAASHVQSIADAIVSYSKSTANGHTNGASATKAIEVPGSALVLVNGPAWTSPAAIAQMARLTSVGIRVMADTFVTNMRRGAGIHTTEKLPYFAEQAIDVQQGVKLMVLAGTEKPVAFFAYPGKPSILVAEGVDVLQLSSRTQDTISALTALADALGCPPPPAAPALSVPEPTSGKLTPAACAVTIARHMPENAIVSDDAVTSGAPIYAATATAAQHDW